MGAATERRRAELDLDRPALAVARAHDHVLDVLGPLGVPLEVGRDRPHALGRGGDGDGLGRRFCHGRCSSRSCGSKVATDGSTRGPNEPYRTAQQPFMPMPNIGTRMPNASAFTWLSSRPDDADDGARRAPATTCTTSSDATSPASPACGAVAPVSRYRLATPISSIRDRSSALMYAHRQAATPMANSTIDTTAISDLRRPFVAQRDADRDGDARTAAVPTTSARTSRSCDGSCRGRGGHAAAHHASAPSERPSRSASTS